MLRYYDLYQRLQFVLCTPDDGCDGHPKHVEGDFAVNKYLHGRSFSTVASVGSSVGALHQKLYIQSKCAPVDGRICRPKHVGLNFIVEPCTDTISINNNQLMHISVFIKNTLKVYLKFLLPRHVSDHIGIHPQGAIIRS